MRPRKTLLASQALALLLACALAASPGLAEASEQEDGTESAAADTTGLVELSPEELFLRASSSALQFQHMLAPSRRLLVRNREESVPYLVTQLDTDSPRERLALEDVLVKIGDPSVLPLIDALAAELDRGDTSRGARLAASILGLLGDDRTVDGLAAAALHNDWKVRSSAVAALGRVAAPRSVPTLLALLDDPNEVVRKSAAVALARISDESDQGLDETVVRRLAQSLDDEHYSVRYGAARALAHCGGVAENVLEELARGGDDDPSTLLSLRALGELATPGARAVLRSLLDADSWLVRGHAAMALGAADPGARDLDKLEDLLSDPHPFPAFAAAEALRSDS
jgi:HEAT repeat protein